MARLDTKTKMMDAGTALFTSKGSFGTVLGQTKAELSSYGKVYSKEELEADSMPIGTEEFDLMLDYSTPWMKRYISCRVEDAGDTGETAPEGEPIRRYAVVMKHGDRNTLLRTVVFILLIILPFILSSTLNGGVLMKVFLIAVALLIAYRWIHPGKEYIDICRRIKADLEKGIQTNHLR